MTEPRTPALTRPANVRNLARTVARARAVQEAAKATAARIAEERAAQLAGPTTPHPGIPPMTTTGKAGS